MIVVPSVSRLPKDLSLEEWKKKEKKKSFAYRTLFYESHDQKFSIKKKLKSYIFNPDFPKQEYFPGYVLWKVKILFLHHFLLKADFSVL